MGALIGGVGQMAMGIEQANADEKSSRTQLDRERQQADVAITGAQEQGAWASGKARLNAAQLAAKQNVAYADSGVDASSGTAADVQSSTMALGELDAQQQSINSAREAWGFKEAKKQSYEEYLKRSSNINQAGAGAILGGMSKWTQGIASIAGSG